MEMFLQFKLWTTESMPHLVYDAVEKKHRLVEVKSLVLSSKKLQCLDMKTAVLEKYKKSKNFQRKFLRFTCSNNAHRNSGSIIYF